MSHRTRLQTQAALLKALAHPARLQILELLEDGEHCVCHLEAALGLRQAYVSQQLAILREAELIADRKEGLRVYYRACCPEVVEALRMIRRACGGQPEETKRAVGTRRACSCPECAGEK
ncbi:MAG: winged helix-turn-helix transcriptional regulator [Chloroflexi bacterium]|nr:winged helix-turn-helix transcriptional regulator [Chloroflexota bacterium]